jgi:indole-3-glycerol phosphate synthase
MNRLARILASKELEIAALRDRPRKPWSRRTIDVRNRLRRGKGEALRLIGEVKLRSPSAGPLSRRLTPAERALAYAEGGAAMVSVLCDGPFFDGAWEHLRAARAFLDAAGLSVPLLAKEFVLDERQILEARDCGADAVLLIARIVDPPSLVRLAGAARAAELEPFVEVANERELEAATDARARVIGVNARDLDTLAMDVEGAARLLALIAGDVVAVHLSGLRDGDAVAAVARSRADAALIGEALMRADDPRPLLGEMLARADGALAG